MLKDGDIVNVDVTVIVDGWHGDTSRTFFVGDNVPIKAKRVTRVAYEAMMKGINSITPGVRFGEIGFTIESFVNSFGYSSVRDYCGHGIGRIFHAEPNVLHFGKKEDGEIIREGMFFTVEPMINIGSFRTKLSQKDGWTVTTKDRSLSAQFEHTVGITKDGVEIFTKSPKGLDHPNFENVIL
jgi:methionyl aminopeptidase